MKKRNNFPRRMEIGSSRSLAIVERPYRDLMFNGNLMQVQADPYTEAVSFPRPYPMVAPMNKVTDVDYPGKVNLAGNTVATATTDVKRSTLFKEFDVANLLVQMKYLGLAIDPNDRNQKANIQCAQVVASALSDIWSTATSNLPIFTDVIDTDMPQLGGGATSPTQLGGMTAFLVWYQTNVQNVASIIARYRMILSIQDHLNDMGWNIESANTTDVLSKFRRNEFRNSLVFLESIIKQEYFDVDQYLEANLLNATVSRRSDASSDPLFTVTGAHQVPKIKVTAAGASSPYLNTMNKTDGALATYNAFNEISVSLNLDSMTTDPGPQPIDYWVQRILVAMSPESILKWSRNRTLFPSTTMTSNQYASNIINMMNAIGKAMSTFKVAVSDLRTFLDVAATRTILNVWTKGVPINSTERIGVVKPSFFKPIDDVVQAAMNQNDLIYDQTTTMWKFYTLWDKLLGIPLYDTKSGGFPIAASTKRLPVDTDYTTARWNFLRFFGITVQRPLIVLNRQGYELAVGSVLLDNANLNASTAYSYMNITSSTEATLGIPVAAPAATTLDVVTQSCLGKFMSAAFDMGRYSTTTGDVYMVPRDKVGLYDDMVPDHAIATINFLEMRSPLRIRKGGDKVLGFKI